MNAVSLRKELFEQAKKYIEEYKVNDYIERETAIIFKATKGCHGNFIDTSYKNILKSEKWKNRLNKKHSHFNSENIKELNSSNSSDALLMNIFCHPKLFKWEGIPKLFNLKVFPLPVFGWQAKLKKENKEESSSTEIDMKIGNIIVEAKLTEDGFTLKSQIDVEKYDYFKKVFSISELPKKNNKYLNYQLIRNILTSYQYGYNFYLICDARRPDLLRNYFCTVNCIKDISLRKKCHFLTWQEIAEKCGVELKVFLRTKYGLT